MKRLLIAVAILGLCPVPTFAGTLAETFDGIIIMGAAPDPLLPVLVADELSHTVSLLDSRGKKYTWVGLTYNGTGTCIARLMNSATKASYPAQKVTAGTTFDRVVHKRSLFFNYSGCRGTTYTSAGTSNSVIEIQ